MNDAIITKTYGVKSTKFNDRTLLNMEWCWLEISVIRFTDDEVVIIAPEHMFVYIDLLISGLE